MQIENSFRVGASPDTVFAFLLDVNRVVGCVPGAELSEVVDGDTFRGKVRIKVGPVTVSYNGTAHITERDAQARSATLQAEGRETTGSGSARATTVMSVVPDGDGSAVTLATDFTVVGKVAQFGRGIMEEVSRKLVGQMGESIREALERESEDASPEELVVAEAPRVSAEPVPVDALAMARSVAVDRLKAAGPGKLVGVGVGLFAVFLIARRMRGRK